MLSKGSFVRTKYYKLLFLNILTWCAMIINTMLDAILGGNQLGQAALTAVSIVAPLDFVICCFSSCFTPGCGILFGMHVGEFQKEDAYRSAGTSVISSIIIGTILGIIFLIIKQPYLHYYGCTGEIYEAASTYYNWYIAIAMIYPMLNTAYFLALADGDSFILMLSSLSSNVINFVLSFILCKKCGTSGLGLATALAYAIYLGILCLHLLKKNNSVHFRWCLDFKILKHSLLLSANTALNYIFLAIVDLIINKMIIEKCGNHFVPAYSVVNFILTFFLVSAATSDACQGMATSYLGEKNYDGVKRMISTGLKTTIILCAVLTGLLLVAAPLIPQLYHISDEIIKNSSILAVRLLAISAIPFGINYFAYQAYPFLNKPFFSIVMSFLYNLLCPLLLSIPGLLLFGFNGISIGLAICPFIVTIIFVIFLRLKNGKQGFPLYLEKSDEQIVSFDINVNKENIVELRDCISKELSNRGYTTTKIELLIEELYTAILEKNQNKKIRSECTLFFGQDSVRLIVRDNGKIFNFMKEDNPVNTFSDYIISCILTQIGNKKYQLSTSFNRNCFIFKKEMQ